MALPQKDRRLAIVVCGHNGSGKSTLWYEFLADYFKIPLLNVDRLLLSLLPEQYGNRPWPVWAQSCLLVWPMWAFPLDEY